MAGVYQVEMPPLPPQPAGQINLPPTPQISPTCVDIAEAVEYNSQVRVSQGMGIATQYDVARGAVYEAAVIAEHADDAVAPAWFAPIRAQLNRMEMSSVESYANVMDRSKYIQKGIKLVLWEWLARLFRVVRFLNGDLPTDPPHNLPALRNEGHIITLSNQ